MTESGSKLMVDIHAVEHAIAVKDWFRTQTWERHWEGEYRDLSTWDS